MGEARQTALERLHKQSISAKDIATQFWCEKQMELFCLHKYSTPQMMKGSAIHNTLQQEVYIPLTVEPLTFSDRLYKFAYENSATISKLLSSKMSRELRLYGSLNGYSISGQVDELKLEGNSVIVVENKTTDAGKEISPFATKPHIVQVMIYRRLLDDIKQKLYTYDNFTFSYRLSAKQLSHDFVKGLKSLGVKDEYIGLESIYKKMFEDFQSLPEIGNDAEIHYFDRRSGELINAMKVKYNKEQLDSQLSYALQYWRGDREAQPVPEAEKWKCRMCKFFGNECKVWWTG